MVAIPIKETPETTVNLHDTAGKEMKSAFGGRSAASITYSLSWRSFPSSPGLPAPRLKGSWRFKLIKANDLPRKDKMLGRGTSDPFVEIIASSKDGKQIFRQQSTCKCKNLDPVYDEVLEIPVAASSGELQALLGSISPSLVSESGLPLSRHLVPEAPTIEEKATAAKATNH